MVEVKENGVKVFDFNPIAALVRVFQDANGNLLELPYARGFEPDPRYPVVQNWLRHVGYEGSNDWTPYRSSV